MVENSLNSDIYLKEGGSKTDTVEYNTSPLMPDSRNTSRDNGDLNSTSRRSKHNATHMMATIDHSEHTQNIFIMEHEDKEKMSDALSL